MVKEVTFMKKMLLSNLMTNKTKISHFRKMKWTNKEIRRKGKEDLRKTLMREITSVDVERVTYHMQHSIPMPKPSIRVFSQKGLLIYRRKVSRALGPIVGRLIVVTAIYLKLMSLTKVSKSLLI
jgi:hypothetical protein